ncbi:MAG TPA: hypothetical protein VGD95_07000 [Micavibrio sp.]
MSFSSADAYLKEMGVTNETASDAQREEALWKAFQNELPDGVNYLSDLAAKAKGENRTVIGLEGHNEQTIKDCQRLCGNVIPRTILEKRLGVAIESYNCHYPVMAPDRASLHVNMQTQIDLQNGNLSSVHC